VVTGVYVFTGIKFDYDLLKLQAPDVPAVEWAMRITQDGGESIYYGVSIVDSLEEARERAAAFRAQPALAEQLGGVGLLIPPREPEKIAILEAMRNRLSPDLAAATAAGTAPDASA